MINFFKTFFEKTVKGNDYAEITVITGILRIAKERIFSGLNNLKVNTVTDLKSEKMGKIMKLNGIIL